MLHRSPDQLLVAVQSLLGHELDEGGVLHLQLPRDWQEEQRGVQDAHLHLCLLLSCILLISTLWRHLGIKGIMFSGAFSLTVAEAAVLLLSSSFSHLNPSQVKCPMMWPTSCLIQSPNNLAREPDTRRPFLPSQQTCQAPQVQLLVCWMRPFNKIIYFLKTRILGSLFLNSYFSLCGHVTYDSKAEC